MYEANYQRLYRLAANRPQLYVGHTNDVQDVLQEVFLKAVQKDVRNHPNVEGWLILATVNVCKNYVRVHTRRENRQQEYARSQQQKSERASLPSPEARKDLTGISDIKMTLRQNLSSEDYHILVQYCLERRSLEEIGREVHMSPNALRVRVFRIRKKLKKYFCDL